MAFTTGNNSIDSLVYSSWNTRAGLPVTLTYGFLTSAPADASDEDRTGFRAMSTTQQAAVRDALAKWAAVANIQFLEVGANFGKLQFGTNTQTNSSGYAYLPDAGITSVTMYLNNKGSYNAVFTPGTYGPTVLIHEIGHMLGLKHPGNYDSSGSTITGPFLPAATDNGDYTQMSYNDPSSYAINHTFATTPMLYDIQAIQYLYGANTSYHTGNDTYAFASNTPAQCIWDAGGTDTLDFSACTGATIINLNAGTFSETSRGLNNVSIAYNVTIEAAVAGSGGATVYANAAGNTLTGGAGADIFYEGAGSDHIAGGAGQDVVVFARSFASYRVIRTGDTLTVAGDGTDVLTGVETLQFMDRTVSADSFSTMVQQGGSSGNDQYLAQTGSARIDAGAGLDSITFTGARAGYSVVATSEGFAVTQTANGTVNLLVNVERVQFADSAVALDIYATAGQLYRLYAAAFDRTPDAGGVGYWLKQVDAGEGLRLVANDFAHSAEFTQLYGKLDNGGFLKQLYANVLDRPYDAAGYSYWLDVLNSGVARGDVLAGFSESTEFQAKIIGSIQNGVEYVPYA